MADAKAVAEACLAAFAAGDLERIVALFAADATVCSPLYGTRPAHAFFADLWPTPASRG